MTAIDDSRSKPLMGRRVAYLATAASGRYVRLLKMLDLIEAEFDKPAPGSPIDLANALPGRHGEIWRKLAGQRPTAGGPSADDLHGAANLALLALGTHFAASLHRAAIEANRYFAAENQRLRA